ncbi:heat shock factor binding protein [Striga asiatica]|uniref:Heat shock factor binding protein n=1 Tax=Striga asiatica TaxID=4170 RepID=A0A5A7QMV4_STRAF|nr:heat shock factor binding protein [Striga asiatica]
MAVDSCRVGKCWGKNGVIVINLPSIFVFYQRLNLEIHGYQHCSGPTAWRIAEELNLQSRPQSGFAEQGFMKSVSIAEKFGNFLANGHDGDNSKQNTSDMTAFVQNLLQQMMGNRIDELEQSINDLRAEMGQEGCPSPSAPLKMKDEPKSAQDS